MEGVRMAGEGSEGDERKEEINKWSVMIMVM